MLVLGVGERGSTTKFVAEMADGGGCDGGGEACDMPGQRPVHLEQVRERSGKRGQEAL